MREWDKIFYSDCKKAKEILGKKSTGVYENSMFTLLLRLTVFTVVLVHCGSSFLYAETFLGQNDQWEAFSNKEAGKMVCYIGSEPIEMRGKYKKRGTSYAMVTHRPSEKSLNVVSIKAGYKHKVDSKVKVIIGNLHFKLFTQDGWAFAHDSKADNALVKAMKQGAEMLVKGISSRGTTTTDRYSLKGFTAAYRSIGRACKL